MRDQLHAHFPLLQERRKGKQASVPPVCKIRQEYFESLFNSPSAVFQVFEFSGANVDTLLEKLVALRT